jgi:hypothetical protein
MDWAHEGFAALSTSNADFGTRFTFSFNLIFFASSLLLDHFFFPSTLTPHKEQLSLSVQQS